MKHLTSLLLVLVAGMTFSAFAQNPLQEKLDLMYQYGHDDDWYGVLCIIGDIDDECKSSSDKNILLQYYYIKGSLYYKIDKYNEAIPLFHEYISLCDELHLHHQPQYLDALRTLAHCYKAEGEHKKAARFYRRTLTANKEELEQFPEIAYETLFGLASVSLAQNDTTMIDEYCSLATEYSVKEYISKHGEDENIIVYRKACQELAEVEKNQGKGSKPFVQALLKKADALKSLESTYAYLYNYAQAISIGKKSIGLNNEVFYPYYDELLHVMAQTDSINHINSLLPVAFDYWQSINDTTRTIYGKYIDISMGLNGLGYHQHSLVYSLKCEEYLNNHQDLYNWKSACFLNYLNLMEAYACLHEADKMVYYRNQLIALSEVSYTDETICSYLIRLSRDAFTNCKFGLAKEYCTITLKDLGKFLGSNNINYIYILNIRGISLLNMNMLDDALKDFNEAFRLCDTQELKDALYPALFNNIGKAYMLKGEYHTALNYFDKAVEWQIKIDGVIGERTQSYIDNCKSKI